MRYRLSENSLRMMEYARRARHRGARAAGAREVLIRNPLRPSGWHLLGTCRMGDDPHDSVVDRWGRAHDVPNLFIVDGSLFVTSAAVNPTTTIQALALRTADYIKRRGRRRYGRQVTYRGRGALPVTCNLLRRSEPVTAHDDQTADNEAPPSRPSPGRSRSAVTSSKRPGADADSSDARVLSDEQRALLVAVLDTVVPPRDGLAGAGGLGVGAPSSGRWR